ncbi:phage tail protein [Aureimonas sp. AU20]|uniref:phage tail protein n=1 Tax=Aureimonas sp. AU20 TaxID=1349819 RepID=UPI0007201EB8|nr:phage tail protein [Aureimonas sp. AU20]ALN73583.1 hypothetical protein M673_12720 [Aureimonas sp. AU20]
MTLPTFIPPEPPVIGSTLKREIKLNKTQFGDGYSQATRDGLNHMRRVVSLRWEALDLDDAVAIDDFLAIQGGDRPFTYTAPGTSQALVWTCEDWNMTQTSGGYASIDATFRQWFGYAS